ncbi:MAG TPA: hypothetical protein VJZ76_15795 [Thermoanaerobaculia bacterium]|nr:hypothetical protein [Thermoanaerobaculia bacterium]
MRRASPIHLLERDYFLQFNVPHDVWPPENLDILVHENQQPNEVVKEGSWAAEKWQREPLRSGKGAYLQRKLIRTKESTNDQEIRLRETIVRFPSAPLFGLQNSTFQVTMQPFSQHTLRLLTSESAGDRPRIDKLFLIFNGLNELDHLDFYYHLAALLIEKEKDDSRVGCLICPFPAHLSRYPLIGKYAEKPLQRFITDPSNLFRQYLRFIVEMQWLISALVPTSDYPVTCGVPLLAEDKKPNGGRCDTEVLSGAIYKAWEAIYNDTPGGKKIKEDDVRQSITVIRELIGWRCSTTTLLQRDAKNPLDPPQLHVIGYSLGGYLAQSVFFTWPFAIGSCTTLCSGGALRDLRPEKIIHEEEWRAITHGLQYEVESSILEGRIKADNQEKPQSVCGIPVSYFTSHFQTFNDIFLQDPHGSYRHRVSEFAPRLFFVVGGNDPIVPTRSVLDTSPPEGINMIQIANLTHWIGMPERQNPDAQPVQSEWPKFWLPTIAGIIFSLSERSESVLRTTMLANLWNDETTDSGRGPSWLLSKESIEKRFEAGVAKQRAKDDRPGSEPLDSDRLQTAIIEFAERLHNGGALLILRNQIPVTLMGPRVLHRRGTVPHFADKQIRTFWQRLQEQRQLMLQSSGRITVVVPARLNQWFKQQPSTLSAKHLSVVREDPNLQQKIWEDFLNEWETKEGALYRFNAEYPFNVTSSADPLFRLENWIREDTGTPWNRWVLNCLPDTWISLSREVATDLHGRHGTREQFRENFINRMSLIYAGSHGKNRLSDHDLKSAAADKEQLEDWLDQEKLQIIRISAAQWSPRYLGERIWDRIAVMTLLTHSALALARSQPCFKKDDFLSGWEEEEKALQRARA